MKETFPRLFMLAQNPDAAVGECSDGSWSPTFDGAVFDQRVAEFMGMQQSFVHMRSRHGEKDAEE